MNVTVTLNRPDGGNGTIDLPLVLGGDTSASGPDIGIPASVSFGPNEASKTVAVSALSDALVEGEETAVLGFGASSQSSFRERPPLR